jgi:hypothetical protein
MRATRRLAACLAGLCLLPLQGHGGVERLDVAVSTPVYALPDTLTHPEGRFDYRLGWMGIPVGHARIEARAAGPGWLDVAVRGGTASAIDLLWRYRVEGHGTVRTDPLAPVRFATLERENDRVREVEVWIDRRTGAARSERRAGGVVDRYEFESTNSFDIPSSVLLVLGLDYEAGDRFRIDTFTGTRRYLVEAVVRGLESIRAGGERRDAWKLRLSTDDLTDRDPDGLHHATDLWVSRERPRVLLRARSWTFVGHVSLELARP